MRYLLQSIESFEKGFLVQLNAHGVFCNDILATNGVIKVVAPVEDLWRWHDGMVATSELVSTLTDPATGVGSLAITRLALSPVVAPFFSLSARNGNIASAQLDV